MDSANSEIVKFKEIVIDKPKENIINPFKDILYSYKEQRISSNIKFRSESCYCTFFLF